MLLTAFALAVALNLGPGLPLEGAPPPTTLALMRQKLLDELNQHRAGLSLSPLQVDALAQQAAQMHSVEMERAAKLRHEDSSGHSPLWRYTSLGGSAQAYGENVGYFSRGVVNPDLLWSSIAELDRRMMAERPPNDGHRKNILSARYSAVGIGVAVGPNGVYITEDFVGYPRARLYGTDHSVIFQLAMMERDGL